MDRDKVLESLKEMFPFVDEVDVITKLQTLPPANRTVEHMIDYCVSLSENKENVSKSNDNSKQEIMEMISLEPEEWGDKKNNANDVDIGAKDKPKQSNVVDLTDSEINPTSTKKANTSLSEQLKEIRKNRHVEWKIEKPNAKPAKPQIGNFQLQSQLKEIREKHNQQWRTTQLGRKRVWTTSDLEERNQLTRDTQAEWGGNSTTQSKIHTLKSGEDPIKIGKESLELTNEFRKKNGLYPLKWHQSLCDIGAKHSKDMGDGKVPFGHQGFDGRVKQYPFPVRGAAENVAMNQGMRDVAKVAVDGWIHSPGHRKNLLSKSMEYCGIGVYKNSQGAWYLTQLFGA